MKIYYIKQNCLDDLKANIANNIEYYDKNKPWLKEYFGGSEWSMESTIESDQLKLIQPEGNRHFDLENTIQLYSALRSIKITQANDERLWAAFTHGGFWNYMRLRWPSNGNPSVVRDRYFFTSNRDRALFRNGISRLWWFGYISYDETRKDPFELTRVLISKQDIAENILGRTFSRNVKVVRALLAAMLEIAEYDNSIYHRDRYRMLMKHINWIGGVKVLDSLDETEIKNLIIREFDNNAAGN